MPILRMFSKHRHSPVIARLRLRYFWIMFYYFYAAVLLLTAQPSYGVKIVSRPYTIKYAAVGGSVTLSCHFSLAPEDLGHLDIEWSIKPLNISEEETTVVLYAGNRTHDDYYPFKGRAKFVSPDPADGDASIVIKELKATDSATYQCKVRKRHRFSSIRVNLTVKERPAKPKCYAKSILLEPCEVVLGCRTTGGSAPILYAWVKENTEDLLPVGAFANSTQGDLSLTKDVPGTYVCTVRNFVGVETCAITVGRDLCDTSAHSGVLATVPLMFMLIFPSVAILVALVAALVVVCYCKRKDVLLDVGNEILEDHPPPRNGMSVKYTQGEHVIL